MNFNFPYFKLNYWIWGVSILKQKSTQDWVLDLDSMDSLDFWQACKHKSSNLRHSWRDCLVRRCYLIWWRYDWWATLAISNAFQGKLLLITLNHVLFTHRSYHLIDGVMGNHGKKCFITKPFSNGGSNSIKVWIGIEI